jgi:hypothetical protein
MSPSILFGALVLSMPSFHVDAPALDQPAFFQQVSEDELAQISGTGIEAAGLDQAGPARDAAFVPIGETTVRTTDTVQELTDNWNFQVGAALIAEATERH